MRIPAWEPQWESRIAERVSALGFSSLLNFVASKPNASLIDLAKHLSISVEVEDGVRANDIAAVQMLWMLLDQAKSTGTVERIARDLLVRKLNEYMTSWPDPGDLRAKKRLGSCLANWSSSISSHLPEYSDVTMHMGRILLDEHMPEGWFPIDALDPVLIDLFHRHWHSTNK